MAQIVYGVLLIVVIVVLPTGIAGGITRLRAALDGRRERSSVPTEVGALRDE